jgi:hypothetical protein
MSRARDIRVRLRVSTWRLTLAIWAASVALSMLAVLPRWGWPSRLACRLVEGLRRSATRLCRYRIVEVR